MYGTHAIANEASGDRYALRSENVDLEGYVGRRITVYGTPVPGYRTAKPRVVPAPKRPPDRAPLEGSERHWSLAESPVESSLRAGISRR